MESSQHPDWRLRLFVAIPVPDAVRAELATVRDELVPAFRGASVSWIRPENMHLTLRFLGDVPCSQLDRLAESVANAIRDCGPLPLDCERLGTFPNLRRPRILWSGVHETGADHRMVELAGRIQVATMPFTREPTEDRFTGHITIARIRQIRRAGMVILAERLERAASRLFGRWTADRVELVRSELSAEGSRYTTMRQFPL